MMARFATPGWSVSKMWLARGIKTSFAPAMRSAISVGVRDGNELIGFAVNDERRRFDLRDAAVGFPRE